MKNLNLYKTANVLAIVAMLALAFMPVFAAQAAYRVPDATGGGGTGLANESSATEIIFRIIQIMLGVAGLVAVIFLIIGGFRYITAGGNEETAEAGKKTITNAIIGIVVILLAFVIVRVISNALLPATTV